MTVKILSTILLAALLAPNVTFAGEPAVDYMKFAGDFLGKKIVVKTRDGWECKGKLLEIRPDTLIMDAYKTTWQIPINNIVELKRPGQKAGLIAVTVIFILSLFQGLMTPYT